MLSLPLRYKLFITDLLIIIFFALSNSILIINISTAITKKNTEELTLTSIEQYSRFLDSKALEYEKSTLAVLGNIQIQELLKKLDRVESAETIFVPYEILNIVNQNIAHDPFLISYTFITPSGKSLSFNREKGFDEYTYYEKVKDSEILAVIDKMEPSIRKIHWFPNKGDPTRINMARKLYDIENFEYLGLLILTLSYDFFDIVPVTDPESNEPITLIANKDNEILLANRTDLSTSEAEYLIHRMFDLFGTQETFTYYDKKFMATGLLTDKKQWKIITIISMDYLLRYAEYYKISIILITVLSFILAGLMAYYLSKGFLKNINILVESMQKVEKGDFNIEITPHSNDEIGLLSRRFSEMVNKINDLINSLYKKELEKKNLEFKALQAQINPHFLYNTLGSIMWLAHKEKDFTVVNMLKSLISLLRFSADTSDFCTLEEETDYIKEYLTLQKYRMEERFNVEYYIEPEILSYKTPKFIIQPFVENALYHGLELSKSNGIIKMYVYAENEDLTIEIHDNGIGMTQEKINSILCTETEEYSGLNSIGVANTDRRLKLYFGENYGVSYISSSGEGTVVKITMPLMEDADIHENSYSRR